MDWERDGCFESACHVFEQDFHGRDICRVIAFREGEDVSADAVRGVVDYPGAGIATSCKAKC